MRLRVCVSQRRYVCACACERVGVRRYVCLVRLSESASVCQST